MKLHNIINEFVTNDGKTAPYSDWLNSLKDSKCRAVIMSHVDRMELGNFGKSEPVGDGVLELKIYYGSGYRVYYAIQGKNIYLLLCGGDKSTQNKDIKLAKKYWRQFKEDKINGQ